MSVLVAEKIQDTEERRLQRAKVTLMRNPAFALVSPFMVMGRTLIDDRVPTACTDGRNEYYNRNFIRMLKDKELAFVCLHEALHKLFKHMTLYTRLFARDQSTTNGAADHVINNHIYELDPMETIVSMPKYREGPMAGQLMGLRDLRFKGMSLLEVYRILKQEEEQEEEPSDGDGRSDGEKSEGGGAGDPSDSDMGEGQGEAEGEGADTGGGASPSKGKGKSTGKGKDKSDTPYEKRVDPHCDEHLWNEPMTAEEVEQLEKDVDQAMREGIIAAKRVGKGAGSLMETVKDLTTPKIDWREALRDFLTSACLGKDMSSWRRINRRLLASCDIVMPSIISERLGAITIAVDTSGSIGGDEVKAFLTEIVSIADNLKPDTLDLLYWDTRVAGHETYNEGSLPLLLTSTRPKGGGGTDPSCVPAYMHAKYMPKPECIVVLTDGCVPNWGSDWPAPVLWVITEKGITAQTGKSVYMSIDSNN